MASPSYTYTLTNGTTADASQVMQNFNDILNGVSDGTKDLSISALTCAGAATLNGHVNLGNSSSDDLTITASLASTLNIKTTASFNIGSSTLGLAGIYFGANSQTVRIVPSGSMSATYTITLPVNAGTAGYAPETNGSGVLSWRPHQTDINAVSDSYTVLDTDGYGTILVTTGSTNRTITLPTAADNTDRQLTIKKVDSGSGIVMVDGEGAETIDGAAGFNVNMQNSFVKLVCDGSAWHVLVNGCLGEMFETIYSVTSGSATAYGAATSYTVFGGTWRLVHQMQWDSNTASYTAGVSQFYAGISTGDTTDSSGLSEGDNFFGHAITTSTVQNFAALSVLDVVTLTTATTHYAKFRTANIAAGNERFRGKFFGQRIK